MTLHVADVASYQGDLTPAELYAAGFRAVNFKVSHGLGAKSVHPRLAELVPAAQRLGMGICTFHYFTAGPAGADQADTAYARIRALGLESTSAHAVDVECSPAPALAELESYLRRMVALLGRPVALYTGDWWWTARPGWDVSELAPYLWSAPNDGYLASYPGDDSPSWRAGYGGWPLLAAMQYTVAPVAGVNVSMSAIRDPRVWAELSTRQRGEKMTFAPDSLRDARSYILKYIPSLDPLSVGIVADDSHKKQGTSYHLGEDGLRDDAYSIIESVRDRNGLSDAASALDLGWFDIMINGKRHTLRDYSVWAVAQCKAGAPDTKDIREIIYSSDGKTVKRWDREGVRSSGDDSHLFHTHHSYYRDSEHRSKVPLFKRYFQLIGLVPEDDDMPLTGEDGKTVWKTDIIPNPPQRADSGTNKETTALFALGDVWARVYDLRDALKAQGAALLAAINALASKDAVDEVALAEALAPAVAAAVINQLPDDRDDVTKEELQEAILDGFRELLNRPASA